jgi:hypothetical protein
VEQVSVTPKKLDQKRTAVLMLKTLMAEDVARLVGAKGRHNADRMRCAAAASRAR